MNYSKDETPYPMYFNTPKDPKLKEELNIAASEDDRSLACIVRKACRFFLTQRQRELSIIQNKTKK